MLAITRNLTTNDQGKLVIDKGQRNSRKAGLRCLMGVKGLQTNDILDSCLRFNPVISYIYSILFPAFAMCIRVLLHDFPHKIFEIEL